MAEYLTVLTTTDSAEKARALAVSAVEAKVAACAQIDGPVTSVYRWENAVQTDQEWRVLYMTTAERYVELEAHIKQVHDYDMPEIIASPVTHGSADYLSWVSEETAKS
ncbi:divalent-cation tolerance protein CutA [Streptomyces chumphonensis]|uniref:Divalent-cation tolerance protein CutA n=1 Tax=Streptomyces chumphonensis TaxID=1214925 RepID=A0A927F4C8_9ACTN|nr:divalent-cation tolerance protein CutA [Streptomyces chumphonensis]MBD3934976.1 divalent-cation tolerance protein CutA [Streptomyces chumphonensis]